MQTDCKPLLYSHYDVTFQEVPGEISLVFDITGCPHHCPDCHSKFLWEYSGKPLRWNVQKYIRKYGSTITCVCFMGGDQDITQILNYVWLIHYKYGLKTCLYTGLTEDAFKNLVDRNGIRNSIKLLDYIKIGPYIKEFGGLDSKTTNQRFYAKQQDGSYKDKTILFQKEYK